MTKPPLEIDWQLVDDLLIAGSHGTEVAAFLGIHPNTLYNRVKEKYKCDFCEYSQQKKSIGEAMIRKQQLHKALGLTKEGDNTLLIWLGKQRLNQSETPQEITSNGEIVNKYNEILNQIDTRQSICKERKMESNKDNTDSIS